MTDAERKLWKHLRLRNVGLFKFRRQHEISPYIVDFVCLEAHLIIEIDGGQHAGAGEYDSARTDFLQSAGYRVLRFWNNEVMENIDGVLEIICNALREDGPPS